MEIDKLLALPKGNIDAGNQVNSIQGLYIE